MRPPLLPGVHRTTHPGAIGRLRLLSTRTWRIRSTYQLRSIDDVVIGYTLGTAGPPPVTLGGAPNGYSVPPSARGPMLRKRDCRSLPRLSLDGHLDTAGLPGHRTDVCAGRDSLRTLYCRAGSLDEPFQFTPECSVGLVEALGGAVLILGQHPQRPVGLCCCASDCLGRLGDRGRPFEADGPGAAHERVERVTQLLA